MHVKYKNCTMTLTLSFATFLPCIWQLKHVSHICIVLTFVVLPMSYLWISQSVCSTNPNFKITVDICGVKSLVKDKVMDYQG